MAETNEGNGIKPRRKRATRREMALRDSRIIRMLASGQSIDEVAARARSGLEDPRPAPSRGAFDQGRVD